MSSSDEGELNLNLNDSNTGTPPSKRLDKRQKLLYYHLDIRNEYLLRSSKI